MKTADNTKLMVCHECDALQDVSQVAVGDVAVCVCCGEALFRNTKSAIEKPLAMMMTCVILFVIANSYPIMQLTIAGNEREVSLIGASLMFFELGNPLLAGVVFLTSVFFPGFCIFALAYILLSIQFNRCWVYTRPLMVWVGRILPWGMMDVFMLGILVALVKLVSFASIELGIGFMAFVVLVICYAKAISSIEHHELWRRLDLHACEIEDGR